MENKQPEQHQEEQPISSTCDDIDINEIEINRNDEVGRGGNGVIYGTQYDGIVVKEIELGANFNKQLQNNPLTNEAIISDILAHDKYKCPYVLKCHGSRIIKKTVGRKVKTEVSYLQIFMEYCSGGNLAEYLAEYGQDGLPEDKLMHILPQVIGSVLYIHSKGICHSDLKPQNWLLVEESEYPFIKISDYGVSRYFGKKEQTTTLITSKRTSLSGETKFTVIGGTEQYNAPEIVDNPNATSAIDLWSLGVVIFELVTGSPLVTVTSKGQDNGMTISTFMKKYPLRKLKLPEHLSPELKDLIIRLLRLSPEERMTWDELCHCPFVEQSEMLKIMEHGYGNVVTTPEEIREMQNMIEKESKIINNSAKIEAIMVETCQLNITRDSTPDQIIAILERMKNNYEEVLGLTRSCIDLIDTFKTIRSYDFLQSVNSLDNDVNQTMKEKIVDVANCINQIILDVIPQILQYQRSIQTCNFQNVENEKQMAEATFTEANQKLERIISLLTTFNFAAESVAIITENSSQLRVTYEGVLHTFDTRNRNEQTSQQIRAMNEAHQRQLDTLLRENQRMRDESETRLKQFQEMYEKRTDLNERQLKVLQQKIEEESKKSKQLLEDKKKLEEEKQSLETEKSTLEGQKSTLENAKKRLEGDNRKLKSDYNSVKSELDEKNRRRCVIV